MKKVIDSSFKTRLLSALVLAPLILFLIYIGGSPFTFLMGGMAAVSIYEWKKMVFLKKKMQKSLLLLGATYIIVSVTMMVLIRGNTDQGLYHILTLLLIVWASDIFAYLAGKSIGGPKLAPKVSPKKTWSGFLGSSFGAGLVAAGMACPWVLETYHVETIGNLSWVSYAFIGFILAMFGQAGDLIVSAFKRYYAVKDTGTLIPGHGGVLDRVDALLLVALVFSLIMVVFK